VFSSDTYCEQMTDRLPILAPPWRGRYGAAGSNDGAQRRRGAAPGPWLLVKGGALGAGRFTVIHQVTGRSIRLEATDVAQAETQVDLLNRQTLEIHV
jgi:hypothetical protein